MSAAIENRFAMERMPAGSAFSSFPDCVSDGSERKCLIMKMFLISDNVDTQTGMRLTGVEGVVVHQRDELYQALQKALADKEIGIILLTEKLGREFPDILEDVRLNHRIPLLIEIHDRHETGRKPDFITSFVNESIGLKL